MPSLDIDLLRVFVAIAETKSFTAAGQRLHRTQSAISLQMKRLERQLDCQLLHRVQGHVDGLTSAGTTLLDYAHEIIRTNDRATAALVARNVTGRIALGLADEAAHQDLSDVLARFQARHPRVHLEVICAPSGQLEQWLRDKRLDLALINRCNDKPVDGLHSCTLFQEAISWVKHEGMPWSDGQPMPLVCFPEGCAYRARAIQSLETNGIEWYPVYTSASCQGVWSAASSGLGVAALPLRGIAPRQPGVVVGAATGLAKLAPVEVVMVAGNDSELPEPQQSLRLSIWQQLAGE